MADGPQLTLKLLCKLFDMADGPQLTLKLLYKLFDMADGPQLTLKLLFNVIIWEDSLPQTMLAELFTSIKSKYLAKLHLHGQVLYEKILKLWKFDLQNEGDLDGILLQKFFSQRVFKNVWFFWQRIYQNL